VLASIGRGQVGEAGVVDAVHSDPFHLR